MADDSIFERVGSWLRGDAPPDAPVDQGESLIEKAAPTQTLGTNQVSANDFAGLIGVPERRLNLIGQQRFDRYEEMIRDLTIVAASVRLLLNLISNAVWTVNPPEGLNDNEAPVAQGYADTAYEILFDMTSSWASVVRKVAAYKLQGFAVMEWTAKRRPDGTIGLLDVEHRPQRTISRWKRDASGTVIAVVQQAAGTGEVDLPRAKLVYAVDDTLTDSPEGMGLYRHLAETADRLKDFLRLEEVGFSTDLRGIPIARAPLGELQEKVKAADEGEPRKKEEARRTAMLRPLRDFVEKHVRNHKSGMVLPSDTFVGTGADGNSRTPSTVPKWGIDLVNGGATSFDAMANAVTRLNQEMARVFGTEHLLLGADGSGSLALAKSKIGTLYLTVTSILLDLVEVFDRDLLAPLGELNGWPPELMPQMSVNEITEREIADVVSALNSLALAGAPLMPNDPAVGEVYDLLGLTRPPERDDESDLSLNPGRNTPKNPADPNADLPGNPEDKPVAKVLRSRRNAAKRRRAR